MNDIPTRLSTLVALLDAHAARQGAKRMRGRGFITNPNRGSHYPAIQSFLDRSRNALAGGWADAALVRDGVDKLRRYARACVDPAVVAICSGRWPG